MKWNWNWRSADKNPVSVNDARGASLAQKVQNAYDGLEGSPATLKVTQPTNREAWVWDDPVTIDAPDNDCEGAILDIDADVLINVTTDATALTVKNAGWNGLQPVVDVIGGKWAYRGGGDPDTCLRIEDSRNCVFAPRAIHGWENSSGNGVGIEVRNVDSFCENNYFSQTKIQRCDIAIDWTPASVTGGDGTDSFLDSRLENLTLDANAYGMRLRGAFGGTTATSLVFFPAAEGATGFLIDGDLSGMTFVSPRFDDTVNYANTTKWETGPDHRGSPLVLNRDSNTHFENEIVRNSPQDDIYSIRVSNGEMSFENIGRGRTDMTRAGTWQFFGESESPQFVIGATGNVEEMQNFNSAPKFVKGHSYAGRDLTAVSPSPNEVQYHDGTGTPSESLCFESGGSWYNIVDGTAF